MPTLASSFYTSSVLLDPPKLPVPKSLPVYFDPLKISVFPSVHPADPLAS
jgi:hypothetical protein